MKITLDKISTPYYHENQPYHIIMHGKLARIHKTLFELNLKICDIKCNSEKDFCERRLYHSISIDFHNEEDAALFLMRYKGE